MIWIDAHPTPPLAFGLLYKSEGVGLGLFVRAIISFQDFQLVLS